MGKSKEFVKLEFSVDEDYKPDIIITAIITATKIN
jgi:hypothetical protein